MDFKRMLIESLEVPEAVPSRNSGDIRLYCRRSKKKIRTSQEEILCASMN